MENRKPLKFCIFLIVCIFLAIPPFSFAYEPQTTHKALTQEILKVFNYSYSELEINDLDSELVMQGSVDEDDGTRPLHHFYDPVYSRGLTLGGIEFLAARPWAQDTLAQAGVVGRTVAGVTKPFFSAADDYSWERAIYEYVWGDKRRGLKTLGHILHLIEDMSVPDHTRNDPHPSYGDSFLHQSSPYEQWADKWRPSTIKVAAVLIAEHRISTDCITLNSCFDSIAQYSNNNFFSKDTISNDVYKLPNLSSLISVVVNNRIYSATDDITRNYLFQIIIDGGKVKLIIKKGDEVLLNNYWSHLSKQAVLHGAGVIKLFFDEVEKEKRTKVLYNKNRSWWQRSLDGFRETIFNTAGVLYGSSVELRDLENDVVTSPAAPAEVTKMPATTAPAVAESPKEQFASQLADSAHITKVASDSAGGAPDAVFENSAPALTPDPAITNNPLSSGGGSSGGLPPGAGAASTNTDAANSATANQQSQTSTESSTSTPSLSSESSTSTPPSSPPPPPPDTTPPDIAFALAECLDDSLSNDGCLLANSAIHLSWSSAASDLAHFELTCEVNGLPCAGFSFAPTSATSTKFMLTEENKIYTFKAKAIDAAGNISSEEMRQVMFSALPVVINEVAWMGTGSSATTSKDEWLELYNNTNYSVNLSGWTISFYEPGTTTPSKTIALVNAIPVKGFYLIERKNDNAVADITADVIYGNDGPEWALNNTGMIVKLERGAAVIDRTPELCGGNWCAGSSSAYQTMERIEPTLSGEVASNWKTALGEFILNGTNADGGAISGTPKKRNSVNYLISQNETLLQNKTLSASNSPYLIARGGLTIQSGVTLTIEPGVVIKFVAPNEPSLVVNGTIQSNGTAAAPVVFTAFSDDTYGGDMNADGICDPGNASSTAACPSPGSWKQVLMNSSSVGSQFVNTFFRYGGRWFANMIFRTMVAVDGTSATFTNSTFEYSSKHGLYLNSSDSNVQGSTFRHNDDTGDPIEDDSSDSGMFVSGGAPTIRHNTFQNNSIGLRLANSSAIVSGNTFTNNGSYAVNSSGEIGAFTQNSGSGNGKNGILLSGQLAAAGATTTLEANAIPYITGGTLPAGAGLVVNPGVEFRGEPDSALTINGIMVLGGASKDDIIFTSLVNSAAGEWGGIVVNAGGFVSGGGFTLRYGGGSPSACFSSCAGFKINGGKAELANALIEKNYTAGMRIINSASTTLSNFEFDQHRIPSGPSDGLILSGASVSLDNVSFSDNDTGIYGDGASSVTIGSGGVIFDTVTPNTTDDSPATLVP